MIHPPQAIIAGQTWYPRDGSGKGVRVDHVSCVGGGGWDYDVWYEEYDDTNTLHKRGKNAYFFQVHYFHPELENQQPTLDQVQRQSVWSKK